jgi:GT2 family glycosyltransferase
MASLLLEKYGLTRERVDLISLERFDAHILNQEHRVYFFDTDFREHYRLIALLSCLFDQGTIFDVGTNKGYSAVALGYNPYNQVISYDLEDCRELGALDALTNIEFQIGDVLQDDRLATARLVMLDTNHDGSFERIFLDHLMEIGFKGLLFLDDIHLNDAMRVFWDEIDLPKADLTQLGHWSGSGLVDFTDNGGPAIAERKTSNVDPLHATDQIRRSFVIPVLDFSPHSRFNITTLLEDLDEIEGEVICIFNSPEVFERLKGHSRIDKYCFNKLNAGVGRSWNMGIDLAEGDAVFVLNADLKLGVAAIADLEKALFSLHNAVIVGPHGSLVDFQNLTVRHYYHKGNFEKPVQTHDVSGFFFCLHLERFLSKGLRFDPRYSPCFMEEWDMALQVMRAQLACYAVPVTDFEHDWGVSENHQNPEIVYFGRSLRRNDILLANRKRFQQKWFPELERAVAGVAV